MLQILVDHMKMAVIGIFVYLKDVMISDFDEGEVRPRPVDLMGSICAEVKSLKDHFQVQKVKVCRKTMKLQRRHAQQS